MRRPLIVGFMLLVLLLPMVPAELESAVSLSLVDTLEDNDIGIRAGKVSPDGISVLLVGESGYAHRISSIHPEDRSMDVTLSTNRNSNLNDVSWHPRGETAFITGDLGVALRYTTDNHAISTLNGSAR